MSKLMAVVWNVNTSSSAPTATLAQKRNEVLAAISNAGVRNYLQSLVNGGMTPHQALDHLAQRWVDEANQRDPFTGLVPASRADALEAAVKAAANWAWSAGNPDLIFVAPEYLFARSGYKHLLSGGMLISDIRSRIESISRQFPHVLLFPGTIAYRESMANQSVRARVRLFEDMEFWKKAGRSWVDEENRDKIGQIAMRGTDHELAQNKAFAYLNGQKLLEYTKRGDFHEVTRSDDNGKVTYAGGSKSGTFHAFGKLFGIEVCLDHNMGYAKFSGGADYDVHVITSAAVKPVEANEKTVGSQPGKVGFVVHASSSKSYTQVVRYAGGLRQVLTSTWEDTSAGHGKLYGYQLDFGVKRQDTGPTVVAGKVSSIKAKFGG